MESGWRKIKEALYVPAPMGRVDWALDCVIALGVFGFGIVQLVLSADFFVPDPFARRMLDISSMTLTPIEVFATLLISSIVVFRRRMPWPCFAATLCIWFGVYVLLPLTPFSMVAVLVSLFTLAYEKPDQQAIWASSIALVAIIVAQLFGPRNALATLLAFQNAFLVIAVAFAGNALAARQERMAAIGAHAIEIERTKEAQAQRRVEEERVRIARELHDITAHSLSAINIQASAAERLIGKNDDEAAEFLSQIRKISKSALADTRAIVGVLRGTSPAETEPLEGTAGIYELVEYLKGFNIDCDVDDVSYSRAEVPSHIDVALFKIAREAVTNLARHSGASHAKICISVQDRPGASGAARQAVLIVSDDGLGIPPEKLMMGGHGLAGMRERAQVLGGSVKVVNNANAFEAGDRECAFSGSGTSIEARIPVPSNVRENS